ncbi:MAG: hypothetical protein GTO40_04080, partial [Deltaproteobacteria bacterium]|nr:hypothetical protein [Deltaproteobacteria bacterium]
VAAGPERPGRPLEMSRRADDEVVRHGIATGIVEMMRPLIDCIRPRLDGFFPFVRVPRLDVRHAVGGEDAQAFFHRYPAKVLNDEQIHKVLGVGQMG